MFSLHFDYDSSDTDSNRHYREYHVHCLPADMVAHHTTLIDRNHQLKLAERQDTFFNLTAQIEELKEQHQQEAAQAS